MRTYTVEFNGYYPVGAVALIVAENIDVALMLINKKLKRMKFDEVEKKDIKQQDNSTRRVDILLDGDY